jgi:MFS family permease
LAAEEKELRRATAPFRALREVFRNPDLRGIQLAWGGMSFATWAFAIALGVYAFESVGAAAVGIAAMVRLLPGALTAPFGGLLGDRHSRRAVLLGSTAGAAVVLGLAAAAVAADAPTALVFGCAGLYTIASSPYIPAEAALMPIMARTPQELSAANVAHSFFDNAGFLAGSLLTGLLLATTSTETVFALAAGVTTLSVVALLGISRDRRPAYTAEETAGGLARETLRGFRSVLADPPLRLLGGILTLLVFLEGAADVLVVLVVLDLLDLAQAAVGYVNAAWGVGAIVAGAGLAVLLHRGRLVEGLAAGGLVVGVALALPGLWPVAVAAYLAWLAIGFGYTLVEVAALTLLQRLGDDEVLARVRGTLETARLGAMALGSIAVTALVAALGIRGTLIALGALLPLFSLLRWRRLRSFEIGSPVEERHYSLLRGNSIFEPLTVDLLERLCCDLQPVRVAAGEVIITQGDPGDRFYIIEAGEVEVLADGVLLRHQRDGECFGEIALLRDVPRTATVRSTRATTLLALERVDFVSAVSGHRRSSELADGLIRERLEPG